MRRYTNEALGFIASVAALTGAALWGAMQYEGPVSGYLGFGVLVALAGLAHLYPVRSAREGAVYVLSNVFLFAGVVLLPPTLIAALGVGALLPVTWHQRRRPGCLVRFAFNSSQSVLAMLSAWSILRLSGALALTELAHVPWVMVAVGVFTAVQTATVAMIIALNSRIPLSRVEGINMVGLLSDAMMPFLGALVAVIWETRPWMLFLGLPPLLLIYWVMRDVQLIRSVDLDAKTGLYNYTFFSQRLAQVLQRVRLVRRPVAVLFADMDHLREINNTHGHLAGDEAIKHVAMVLQRELPKNAVVARFGGEEFVALLPGVHPDEAEFIGWRLCRAVHRAPVTVAEGAAIQVSVSVGVAGFPQHGSNPDELVHAADVAVYQAKARGRNRVISARSLTPEELKLSPAEVRSKAAPQAAPEKPEQPAPLKAAEVPAAPQPALPEEKPLSRGMHLLIAGLTLAAAAALWSVAPSIWQMGIGPVLVTGALGIVTALFKITIPAPGNRSALTLMPTLAVISAVGVLYGPGGAAVAALAGISTQQVIARRTKVAIIAFNLSNAVLQSVATAWVLALLPTAPDSGLTVVDILVCVLAAAANYAVSHGLVAVMLIRRQGLSLREVLRGPLLDSAWQYIMLGSMGAFMAIGYRYLDLPGALMFILPAVVLYRGYTERLQKSCETIDSLEQIRTGLEKAQRLQKQSLDELVVTLAGIVDARDASVAGHSLQVARYAVSLARELGQDEEQVARIRLAGLLHDLGKIGVPEHILHKPGKLTPDEWVIMRSHAALGERLLSQVSQLGDVARMVGEHHEKWNGRGYPYGKAGAGITLGGRILAVADAMDSILSDRPYSKAKSLEWALVEMERCAGDHFDPDVVRALKQVAEREGAAYFVNSAGTPAESYVQAMLVQTESAVG